MGPHRGWEGTVHRGVVQLPTPTGHPGTPGVRLSAVTVTQHRPVKRRMPLAQLSLHAPLPSITASLLSHAAPPLYVHELLLGQRARP